MTINATINFSPADTQALLNEVISPLLAEIRELQVRSEPQKYIYTVQEIADKINYGEKTVRAFITHGRKARNGKIVRLKARELTAGDYRILSADLDAFIAQF